MAIDVDATLDSVITLKRQIASLQGMLDTALDALRQAVDEGDLDPQFSHNDATFNLNAGRASYDYPPEVTQISQALKLAQADAVANGTATIKRGEPFWTVKLPKPGAQP